MTKKPIKNPTSEKTSAKPQMIYRKVKDLKGLPNNPRTITEKEFKSLCKSLKSIPNYLEARPLVLSDRTGEIIIIDGNQRCRAALDVGMLEVPTFLMSGLTEKQEREIIIRANVANGDWDWEKLANEWAQNELDEWGVDVPEGYKDEPEEDNLGGEGEETIEATIKIKCPKKEKDDIVDWLNIKFKETGFKNIVID